MRKSVSVFAAALALALAATSAQAHVLDSKLDKPAFKLRGDVAKQVSKYVFCLVKATSKCEKKGVDGMPECHLDTGIVDYDVPPDKATTKFQDAIAKCNSKLNLTKKGNDYTGIGCPGDCDDGADGIQQCSGLPEFADTVKTATTGQLGVLQIAVAAICVNNQDCVETATKQLVKYAQGQFKCAQKCELDVKGKKGGGGNTNSPVCMVTESPATEFTACVAKPLSKVTAPATSLVGVLAGVIDEATDGLFNREDPTDPDSPAGTLSPCGTCGNNTREGTEECDGTDSGICGACASDCTCQ